MMMTPRFCLFAILFLVCVAIVCVGSQPAPKKTPTTTPTVTRSRKYLLKKPQCNDVTHEKTELVIAKLATIGPRGRPFPETLEQVKSFCRDTNRMIARVEAYLKDCYEKSVRDYANILLYTLKRNIRKYCARRGSKVVREFLKLGPCANKHIQSKDPCIQGWMRKTKGLIGLKEDRHKIHWTCCFYAEAIQCAEEFLDSIPCIREHRESLMELFQANSSSMTDLLCGDFSAQTDACEKLGPPPKPEIEVTKVYVSPVSVLIDLIESMDNFTSSALPK